MTTTEFDLDLVTAPAKEVVKQFLDRFSDDVSLNELAEEIGILARVRDGLIDVREGRVISFEELKRKHQAWLTT